MSGGVLEAWSAAVGDGLNEVAGFRFTRLTASIPSGTTTFPVETTLGWPTAGRLLLNGQVYTYSGKTATSFTGVRWTDETDDQPVTGTFTAPAQQVVVPLTGSSVVRAVISGTWAGTILLERNDPSLGWTVVATYNANVDAESVISAGAQARLRMTVFTSGSALVSLKVVSRSGAKEDFDAAHTVLDFSRTYSAVDAVRSQLFVNTAVGFSLDVLARNRGVERPPNLSDDEQFRKVVKAMAYLPKGTIYGLEMALTAFFGAGNFLIYEDFPTFRNTVFIKLLNGVGFRTTETGQTYLMRREVRPLSTGPKTVTVLGGPVLAVQGVHLANEDRFDNMDATKPSALTEIRYSGDAGWAPWTFFGTNEAADASMASQSLFLAQGGAREAGYYRTSRIRPESNARLGITLKVAAGMNVGANSGKQFCLNLRDGGRDIAVGFIGTGPSTYNIGFIDVGTGAFIAGPADTPTLSVGEWHDIEIRKPGTQVELWLDGKLVQAGTYVTFPSTVLNEFRYGGQDAAFPIQVSIKSTWIFSETLTDYWNISGILGDVNTAQPVRLDTNSAALVLGDVGKAVRTQSAVTAKNTGLWLVNALVDPDRVDLIGVTRTGAFVESTHAAPLEPTSRVSISGISRAFVYPTDKGKQIELLTGSPNGGVYTINEILDAITGLPISGNVVQTSHMCEVAGNPAFTTEVGIDWRLIPVFVTEANIVWQVVGAGSFAGLVLTLRANPPLNIPGGYVVIMEATYSSIKSGQLLSGTEVSNDPVDTYYPFYLPQHPLGPYAVYLDDLTVAGVIPEIVL